MRTVYVEVKSDNDKAVDAEIRVERRKDESSSWNVDKSYAVTSGLPDAKRQFLLGDNERIIIEPRGKTEIVLDRVNNAVMTQEALDSQPTDEQKMQIEADRQKELKTGVAKTAEVQKAGDQAASRARDEVLQKQKLAAEAKTPNPAAPAGQAAAATGTSQGAPQSPAAAAQSPRPNTPQNASARPIAEKNVASNTSSLSSDQMSSTKDK